eukprot:TRINITY_DN47633_c0_g1_i1.p1 TRINITY_DN47633_c0_g1~~TRINITY_DN47633_c0_g1_i1.p1  ORF type:complete len:432 (-),score=64.15 TRINITY_DN47633_c0_g1_i1:44-1339(-)
MPVPCRRSLARARHRAIASVSASSLTALPPGTCLRGGDKRWRQCLRWRHQSCGEGLRHLRSGGAALSDDYRFSPHDTSGWKRALHEHGVTVLAGVLSKAEVLYVRDLVWSWLECLPKVKNSSDVACSSGSSEHVMGIRRDAVDTWTTLDGRWPSDNSQTGIVCSRGAGQSPAAWYVRGHDAVQKTFASIWNVPEHQLLTSMDGVVLWRPWQLKPKMIAEQWRTRGGWLHVDQNVARRPHLEAIQGMMALTSADSSITGGFVCAPGSHVPSEGAALIKRLGGAAKLRRRGDFLAVPCGDPLELQAATVPLKQGDLLLWDSRLVHGSEPAPGREAVHNGGALAGITPDHATTLQDEASSPSSPALDLLRVAVPVCMVPRSFALDPAELSSWRAAAVKAGLTTKHWPHRMRVQGEAAGPGYVPPDLTPAMKRVL